MALLKSLRFRLILLVLMAVIPAMGVTLFNGLEQRRLARINAEEEALRLANIVARQQASVIEGARQLLLALSLIPVVQSGDQAVCNSFMETLHDRYPLYSVLVVATPDGEIVCSSMPEAQPLNISDRPYFQRALQDRDFVVGKTVISRFDNQVVMPFAMPVIDERGNITRVLAAGLDMQVFSNIVQDIDLPPEATLLVIDGEGTVLTRFPERDDLIGTEFSDAPLVRQILNQPEDGRAQIAGLDGVQRFYGFTPVESSGGGFIKVSIGIPVDVAYAVADHALVNNLIMISLIGLLSLAVAWFGGDVLFLRVVSLTAERDEAERRLREANLQLEQRVIERTAELDKANKLLSNELEERQKIVQQLRERERELEKMLEIVERSNSELESFAYITSHDLQEPLRKIQAFGDRLSKRYENILGDEGASFVNRMVSAAHRMQMMINDLLDYSRITTRGSEFTNVDLNEIVKEVIADLEVRVLQTKAQIQVMDLPTVKADALQMRQLFQNLVQNALKFHRPGIPPVIKVGCEEGCQDLQGENKSVVKIYVEDNGIGFEEKYLDRIFLPFQRLHTQDVYEGSGIGLAICRRILDRHGGSLTASSSPGSGSRFTVILPYKS